jgi:hypothetical protein
MKGKTIILLAQTIPVKPGLVPLIIGGALLAAGLILAGISTFSVTKQVLEGSTIIDASLLEPNLSLAATIKELPADQELLLSLSGDPADVPLQVRIAQPDGTDLISYDVEKTPFTTATATEIPGDHTLEIKNIGSRSVTVSGALLNSPVSPSDGGINIADDPSIQNLVAYGIGILVGLVLIIAGIVLLIIGAVRYIKSGRKTTAQGAGSPTS